MGKTKAQVFFFGLSIAVVSLFILSLLMIELEDFTSNQAEAYRGKMSISGTDFNSKKLIGLVGDYEFYWNQLLSPLNLNDSANNSLTGYIHLPGLWNGYSIDEKKLSGDGFATFRIRIKVPDEDFYSIKIKEFDCAYKLWVNGVYVECGKVGTSKNDEKPAWKRNEIRFFTKDRQANLIFQVSNFNHRKGGPEDLMLLGKSDSITRYKVKQLAITYFLLGIFFIMFIYNYGLYIYRRKEKSYLYFSIICLLIMLRLITTGEKVIYDILPSINWWLMIRIEYLSYTMVIPLFYMFMRFLYPDCFSKLFERVINTICLIVIFVILFTPVKVFSYSPIFYQVVVAFTALFILYGLIKAAISKKDDSLFMLLGYFLLFAICINDILYYNKIFSTTFLMPFGLFIIVFVNAFTLSKRFSNSFQTIEALTQELSISNVELEERIIDRTQEVMLQKEELEKQALALQETNKKIVELSTFKDSMTQMIIHDLKNPLNTILNISTMDDMPNKDNLIHEAGRVMNNLVMNILDVFKYENTTMVLNKEPMGIKELIDGALDEVSFLGKLRKVTFSFTLPDTPKINLDKGIMHRVLVNLLTNAIKFSPISGKVELSVLLIAPDTIKISVKDNGLGIKPERQKTIFDRYQSEAQQDSLLISTGLGLSFCKMAIESHGGSISVESVNSQGSTFSVVLPLTNGISKGSQRKRMDAEHEQPEKYILDKEDIMAILPYIDELRGYEVYQVTDIVQALQMIKNQNSIKLQKWVTKVTDAVLLCQQDSYNELINLVRNE